MELNNTWVECPHCGKMLLIKNGAVLLTADSKSKKEEWDENLVKLKLESPDWDD